jgi:hypothetical protein
MVLVGMVGIVAATGCGGVEEYDESSVDPALYEDVYETIDSALNGSGGACVRPGTYWKEHHRYAADPAKQIPWPLHSEDRLLCGQTLVSIMGQPFSGDPWHAVALAWIPAYLNLKSGAWFGPGVQPAFQQAFGMLLSCSVTDVNAAHSLVTTLKTWSNGQSNAASCFAAPSGH